MPGPSSSIETRSLPTLTRSYPRRFTLITRTSQCLRQLLAALPSTRAIETRSLPSSLAATHSGFAFYVAFPKSSIPNRDVFYVADPISFVRALAFQFALLSLNNGSVAPALQFEPIQSCIVSRL